MKPFMAVTKPRTLDKLSSVGEIVEKKRRNSPEREREREREEGAEAGKGKERQLSNLDRKEGWVDGGEAKDRK